MLPDLKILPLIKIESELFSNLDKIHFLYEKSPFSSKFSKNSLNFTHYYSEIRNFILNIRRDTYIRPIEVDIWDEYRNYKLKIGLNIIIDNNNITIKLLDDDYFLVNYNFGECYICDGEDGLKQFLKDFLYTND